MCPLPPSGFKHWTAGRGHSLENIGRREFSEGCYATCLEFWYWFFAGPALLLAFLSLRGERKRAAYVERRLAETPETLPPASIIVPVKGADEGLRENLAALASQDYPDYELVVMARSAADIPPDVLPNNVRVVLAHGDDPSTGEKVQNLKVAVAAARKFSQVYAFADSDGRVTPRWLRSLVAPLAEPMVGASTGYRWYAPVPPTFWSLMRSVWDAVALSRLGPGDCGFAWGGAGPPPRDVPRSGHPRPLERHRERRLCVEPGGARRRPDHRLRARRRFRVSNG